jgi:hypothetical protein
MLSSSDDGSALGSTDASILQRNILEPKRDLHIAFVVTTGFAARMMLRTGITSTLRSRGAQVTVISPNADEAYFQQECDVARINLRQSAIFPLHWANRFRSYRSYFMDDVLNNAALRALHCYRFKNRSVLGFTLKMINRTIAHTAAGRQLFRQFERRVNRSKTVEALLQDLKPDLLVASSPFGTQETVYILHAKELGIPVVCPILSWDNITTKGALLQMPDYFISWGPIMTDEIVNIYQFPKDRIYECGVPHFDIYARKNHFITRTRLLENLQIPPDLP